MDLKQMATQMFMEKVGGNVDANAAQDALSQLIGEGQDIDIAGMVSQLGGGGLAGAAQSWLGDGANDAVSADQITQGLGADQIADFASKLGLSQDDAAGGLAQMIPNLVNESSQGGNLLGTVAGLASKLFK